MSLRSTFTVASIRGWQAPRLSSGPSLYNPLSTDIQFGRRVKLSHDGNYLIAGSTNGAWIYKRNTGGSELNSWSLQQQLPTPAGSNSFGYSVDINGDGSLAAVGDPTWNSTQGTNQGRLSTFSRSGTTWSSVANITAPYDALNLIPKFAREVTMDSIGTTIVPSFRTPTGFVSRIIYTCNLTSIVASNNSAWTGNPKVLALSSQGTKLITNLYETVNALTVYTNTAYTLSNDSGILASSTIISIAVNSDGTCYVYGDAGTPGAANTGTVTVRKLSAGVWSNTQLTFTTAGDKAGISVDINNAGDTIVIGTLRNTNTWVDTTDATQIGRNQTTGIVYVYRLISGTWTQSATIECNTGSVDGFGISVSIDKVSGTYIAIGSPTATASLQNVKVYRYNGATWSNNIT